MKTAISKHMKDFIAIIALIAIAAGVSYYILINQRVRFPVIEPAPFYINAELQTGQAVTPGQGQTVRVSGVRIGDISDVRLREGKAVVELEIDDEFRGLVRQNWSALLRPRTGLKDMFIELYPGEGDAPPAEEGYTIPVNNTLPDINPDEFLAALDVDTRDYLKLLLQGAREGLEGRADDLRDVLKRFEPTYRDLARVSSVVATRRQELRRLIHNLNRLNQELGDADDDLAELVQASSATFEAFADEQENVRATVQELPSALRQTTDTLGRVEAMAQVLRPAADRLRPPVRALQRFNEASIPMAREITPLLREDIRPFVREAQPVVRQLRPAVRDIAEADPRITRVIRMFNTLFNIAAHNPRGREGPEVPGRQEGYLFYLAWLSHQSIQIFSGQDAHGVFRPLAPGGTCNALRNTAPNEATAFILGATGALTDPRLCGGEIPPLDEVIPDELSPDDVSLGAGGGERDAGRRGRAGASEADRDSGGRTDSADSTDTADASAEEGEG
jgi:phospholipid/cholesterol/gamma-HCH transport system substrate-binding protein